MSGDARLQNVAGEVNGNTVSGNFNFELGTTSALAAARHQRRSRPDGPAHADARLDIESISGDVRVDLPGKPSRRNSTVSSFNGEIRNCFGPKPDRTDEYTPGRELRFREGTASAGAYGSRR